MFDEIHDEGIFAMSGPLEALCELEKNTNQAIIQQRASQRLEIRTKLTIRPANASQRQSMAVDGLTADMSDGGCMVLLPRPVMAGDVFWLTFDDTHVAVGSLFARCLRCRMVREDAFEVGFRFFSNIELASAIVDQTRPIVD